jgi:hypothetical protein
VGRFRTSSWHGSACNTVYEVVKVDSVQAYMIMMLLEMDIDGMTYDTNM